MNVSIPLQRTALDILKATGTVGYSISYWCESFTPDRVITYEGDVIVPDWGRVPELVFHPDGIRDVNVNTLSRLRSCFIDHVDIIDPDGLTDDILVQLACFGKIEFG